MKLKITKVCEAILDTDIERQRISKAFRDNPETQQQLTILLDAIEEMNWEKAYQLLDSKWWNGRDKKLECPRLEFIGGLKLRCPDCSKSAIGFENWLNYLDLVSLMYWKEETNKDGFQIKVEPFLEKE